MVVSGRMLTSIVFSRLIRLGAAWSLGSSCIIVDSTTAETDQASTCPSSIVLED